MANRSDKNGPRKRANMEDIPEFEPIEEVTAFEESTLSSVDSQATSKQNGVTNKKAKFSFKFTIAEAKLIQAKNFVINFKTMTRSPFKFVGNLTTNASLFKIWLLCTLVLLNFLTVQAGYAWFTERPIWALLLIPRLQSGSRDVADLVYTGVQSTKSLLLTPYCGSTKGMICHKFPENVNLQFSTNTNAPSEPTASMVLKIEAGEFCMKPDHNQYFPLLGDTKKRVVETMSLLGWVKWLLWLPVTVCITGFKKFWKICCIAWFRTSGFFESAVAATKIKVAFQWTAGKLNGMIKGSTKSKKKKGWKPF